MRLRFTCVVLVALPLAAQAEVYRGQLVDPAFLATIEDEYPTLPRGFAPHERGLPLPDSTRVPYVPPSGGVRAQAEYEVNDGLLVRWNSGQNALQTQMVVAVTTLDTQDAKMFVVVRSAAEQASATSTFTTAGANMSRVAFVTQPCSSGCSVWMRDYGPRLVDNEGVRASIDHVYNRPRPVDDAFPGVWSTASGDPNYAMPITHGGGNFHLFSDRRAYMTQLISNENPGLSSAQIVQMYQDYQGLNVEIVPAFPSSFDSTQHIDMWIYPVDDDEIIVGEYPVAAGSPRTIANDFAAARAADGYTVYRTPGWNSGGGGAGGGAHFTYTNAIAINSLVLTCTFDGFPAENAAAQAVFATAFQDKTIVPINCSGIIGLAGAIHCIVMHVPRMAVGEFADGFEDP